MAEIVIDRVSKIFQGNVVAVHDVSLTVPDGEFLVLVGPSGCGKSTLLRLLAGLEEPSLGRITIGGRDVTDVPPKHRDIAMVFQNYALYPHMSVRKNLSFGLKIRDMPKAEVERRVAEVSSTLGLDGLLDRKPGQLSGGQRQRVAMGRAIVRDPQAFLMDEPLSNLDAKLRVSMRSELARLHERLRTTTVYVTHDQTEAMTLGHRVAVMHEGKVQQVDTPDRLFRHPRNLFVAGFIGSPSMNLVRARVDDEAVAFAGFRIPVTRPPSLTGREVILGIRPSDFEDGRLARPELPRIRVTAEVVESLGTESLIVFPVDAPPVTEAMLTDAVGLDAEESRLVRDDRALFTARVSASSTIAAGESTELALDSAGFHFFDPETGEAIAR